MLQNILLKTASFEKLSLFLENITYSCSPASYDSGSPKIMFIGQELVEIWGVWHGHSRFLKFWFQSKKGSSAWIIENSCNTYVGYITFSKEANSSFLYPSRKMGCFLSWPSVIAPSWSSVFAPSWPSMIDPDPEGKRNMSAKISEDCTNFVSRDTEQSVFNLRVVHGIDDPR